MSKKMIQGAAVGLQEVSKAYGNVRAVDGVSISIKAGEFLTLLGPSGSGKTTTLMLVAGFETLDSGDIYIGDRRVTRMPPYQRDLGFVFQHYALFPHMSVADNLAYPLRTRGVAGAEIDRRVGETLDLVMLPGLGDRMPSQLSGGQQQRVALARALIFNPPVLLMDEPLSALDKKLRQQMQLEIKQITHELGITIVYVTHDQEEALTMSDRVAVMNDGKIAQVATPEEIYENPRDSFVADFIGETNLIRGAVSAGTSTVMAAETPGGLRLSLSASNGLTVGEDILLALRPERVCAQPPDGNAAEDPAASGPRQWFPGTVDAVVYVGAVRKYRVRVGGETLLANQQAGAGQPQFASGDAIHVGWYPDDLKLIRNHGANT